MLKKENRLKKRKEFNYVYKKGEIAHSTSFFVHYTKTWRSTPQIGISVSKQVGNSVVRSRVKRIISEACRLNIEKFENKNYVITAKQPAVTKTSVEISNELLHLLKKAGLLKVQTEQAGQND